MQRSRYTYSILYKVYFNSSCMPLLSLSLLTHTCAYLTRPSPLPQSNDDNANEIIKCTDHMCPIRVHWHFKNNYMNQWRVKLTISNYNLNRNYSNWNVLIQHPGLSQKATTYSFNSVKLPTLGLHGIFLLSLVVTLHLTVIFN